MPEAPSSANGDATAFERTSAESEPRTVPAAEMAASASECDELQPSVNGTAAADGGQEESQHAEQAAVSSSTASPTARPEPAVQISGEVAAALLARLRFRRQLHQVRCHLCSQD